MLTFIIGLVVGGCFGIITMVLIAAAFQADEHFVEYDSSCTSPRNAEKQAEEALDESN